MQQQPGVVSTAASTVAQKAEEVGATASEEARAVARDAKFHAQHIVHESRESLRAEASTQATRLAATLRDVGQQLRSMAQSQPEGGVAVNMTEQLAETTAHLAQRLDDGGIDAALTDAARFARRRPALFLASAMGAGFAVGRLLKAADTHSLMETARESNDASATAQSEPTGTWSAGEPPELGGASALDLRDRPTR
jgi:hypothetical protein